jgi:hypothetical protein
LYIALAKGLEPGGTAILKRRDGGGLKALEVLAFLVRCVARGRFFDFPFLRWLSCFLPVLLVVVIPGL